MANHLPDEKKMDRRFQRTEKLLSEALIALIVEKGYDAITVQDVLDRANMGRSTFYAHYRDKEDLLLSSYQSLFESFKREYMQTTPPGRDSIQTGKDLSLFFFRHAGSHRDLFKALIGGQGGKIIQEYTFKNLTKLLREHIAAQLTGPDQEPLADLIAHYIAGSYLSVLTWWLDHNLPYTAEEMDAAFQKLVIPGINVLLAERQ